MIPRHVLLPLPERRAAEPLVRAWLAAQWQRDATRLPLHRDPRGRPRLAAPMDDCDAGWSHSGGWLLLACGRGLRLGCDLERERPRPVAWQGRAELDGERVRIRLQGAELPSAESLDAYVVQRKLLDNRRPTFRRDADALVIEAGRSEYFMQAPERFDGRAK